MNDKPACSSMTTCPWINLRTGWGVRLRLTKGAGGMYTGTCTQLGRILAHHDAGIMWRAVAIDFPEYGRPVAFAKDPGQAALRLLTENR